jgi:CBS domain-containing protein
MAVSILRKLGLGEHIVTLREGYLLDPERPVARDGVNGGFPVAGSSRPPHSPGMNIAFFLTPKQDVVWVSSTATLADALAHMEPHRHSAVPLLDADGRYVGTLAEGDLLSYLRHAERPWTEVANQTRVSEIPLWLKNEPINIDAEMETLVARAAVQSFVPVVDDRRVFVGMVRRKRIIEYCAQRAGIAG